MIRGRNATRKILAKRRNATIIEFNVVRCSWIPRAFGHRRRSPRDIEYRAKIPTSCRHFRPVFPEAIIYCRREKKKKHLNTVLKYVQ